MANPTATNPQTGEKLELVGGQWKPLAAASPTPPPSVASVASEPGAPPSLLQRPPSSTFTDTRPAPEFKETLPGQMLPAAGGTVAGLLVSPIAGALGIPMAAGTAAGAIAPKIPLAARLATTGIQTALESVGAAGTSLAEGGTPQEAKREGLLQAGAGLGFRALGAAAGGIRRLLAGKGATEAAEKLAVTKAAGVPMTSAELTQSPPLKAAQGVTEVSLAGQAQRAKSLAVGDKNASRYVEHQLDTTVRPSGVTPSEKSGLIQAARDTGAQLGRQHERSLWQPIEDTVIDLSGLAKTDPQLAAQVVERSGVDLHALVQQQLQQVQALGVKNFSAQDIAKMTAGLVEDALKQVPLKAANAMRSELLAGGRLGASQGLRNASQGFSQHQSNILFDAMEQGAQGAGIGPEFKAAREATKELHDIYGRPNTIGRRSKGLVETPEKIVQSVGPDQDKKMAALKTALFRYVKPGTPEGARAVKAWDNAFDQFMRDKLGKVVTEDGIRFENLAGVHKDLDKFRPVLDVLTSKPGMGSLVSDPRKVGLLKNLRRLSEALESRTETMGMRTSEITGGIRTLARFLPLGLDVGAGTLTHGLGTPGFELGSYFLRSMLQSDTATGLLLKGFSSTTKEAAQRFFTLAAREAAPVAQALAAHDLVQKHDDALEKGDAKGAAAIQKQLEKLYMAKINLEPTPEPSAPPSVGGPQ